MKKAVGTAPYKGVRDFYPEEFAIREYIFSVMRDTAQSFGYREYDASILEPTELYHAKSSEEIVSEQTYTFADRGERSVTLRPEMTPTVARMIAARIKELPLPQRWFSLPNVFRYERPQRGRLREHWQLNVDVFGIQGLSADKEVLLLAGSILRNFGLTPDNYVIRLNDRRILDQWLEELGVSGDKQATARRLLDNRRKIDEREFADLWQAEVGQEWNEMYPEPATVHEVREFLHEAGFPNAEFDPTLVRGFDYYTGVVFEIFDTNPDNPRSLFGGGRYDNLLDVFGLPTVPAFGFGMGDVTIRDVLETYALLPKLNNQAGVYIGVLDHESFAHAEELAQYLRLSGVPALVDLKADKIGNQLKRCEQNGLRYFTAIGETEREHRLYAVKDITNGYEESSLTPDGMIERVSKEIE